MNVLFWFVFRFPKALRVMESSSSSSGSGSATDSFFNFIRVIYVVAIIDDVCCVDAVKLLLEGGSEHLALVVLEIIISGSDSFDDVFVCLPFFKYIKFSLLLLPCCFDVFESSLSLGGERIGLPHGVRKQVLQFPDHFVAIEDLAIFCLAIEVAGGSSAFVDKCLSLCEFAVVSTISIFSEKHFFATL